MKNAATAVRLADGRTVKLGRIRPVQTIDVGNVIIHVFPDGEARTALKLGNYHEPRRAAKQLPDSCDYFDKAAAAIREVLGNDQQGDCVIASAMHQAGLWTAAGTGTPVVGSSQEALSTYHKWCGPGDNGCIIQDVLDRTKAEGIPVAGKTHKIAAYAHVDWTKSDLLKAAILEFGTVKFGVNLPSDWTCTNCKWDVTASRNVGGHDVPAGGYDATGVKIATWGGICTITNEAVNSRIWIEEAWVPISEDFLMAGGLTPLGFNLEKLKADLALLEAGQLPDITPPSPQPPPPGPGPGPIPPAVRGWLLKVNGTVGGDNSPKTAYDFALSLVPNFPPAPPPKERDGMLRIGSLPPIPPEVWAWIIALIQSLITKK